MATKLRDRKQSIWSKERLPLALKELEEARRHAELHEASCATCKAGRPCNIYGRLAWLCEDLARRLL